MNSFLSDYILSGYFSKIETMKDETLQSIYRKFRPLYFNLTIDDINIKDQIIDHLKKYKFLTYEVTRTSIIEQNPQEMNLNDRSNQLLNVKFCGEKYYFVIDNIEFQIISDIIQNLTETKLINFTNRKIFPSKMEKDDFDAQKEVMNFKNHFKSIIESDYFINNTITIISGYFIRRFYCPSNFFKRKIFKFQYEDVILESMLKNYFYYSKYKEDSELSHNILLYDVIKRILKNKIVDFGFKYELYHFIEDDFIILRELSVTRNGIYKLVYYKKRNYLFAIKYILPNQSEKEIQKEMNFCDNFKHRSFICFYGYLYRNETKIGFVYEFMSNGTLYDYINNKSNQKSQIWLLNSIARIYKGINYLYNNHLIHRDIKPQNILLNHDNLPFISDFETIRYINEDDDENQKEDLTGDIGSDSFASPEQHRNVKTSFSTDIYSFGLIVYFLYEEKSLWNCNYIYSNIFDFEQKKKKLENVDSNIKDIYESCVKFNPNERMKHADIMNKIIDELDAFDDFNQAFNKMSDFIEHFIQILYFISQRNDKENGIVNSLLKIYKYCNIYINKELVLNELELKETVSNTLIDFFNRSWKESIKKTQLKNKSFIFFAKAAAMLNNQKALLYLGNYYLYANVAPNEISGKQYLEMAIKYYNNPNALYILGKYLIENGREQNVSKGIKYLDLAAKQNHADSLYLLGTYYDIGIFFEQDSKRAMLYFELAAKQESYYYPNNFSIFENDPFIENISTTKSLCYYYLGIHYLHGDGIDEDLVIAKKYFEKAISEDNIIIYSGAYCILGEYYLNGIVVKQDFSKALEYFEKAAINNNLNALLQLGVIYIMGKNVKQDYLKAKNYFEKAAKYGSSEAFFALGGIYEFGLGVEQNSFIAKSHYEFSANKNNSDAQFRLGNCYMYGLGCEPDVNKAILNYELSAKQNNMSAILTLGYLYEEGFGVKQDYSKAIKYYQLLANQDNSDALNCLGIIYLLVETEKDYLKAKFYLESAAKLNNSNAMCNLGYMHFKGFGVEKNYLKAKEYFELSAEQSNRFAYIYLAKLYEFGFGVKQDYLKAKEYLEKAAKANDPYAFENLGNFYINGYGVEQNFLIAKDYFELSIRSYNPSANFILADFFSNGFIFEIDYFRAIQYLMKSIAIHDGKVTFYEYSLGSFRHINVYNEFYYHSNNSLGLIYMIQFQDLEKANIYIKEAAFGEYPFAQNNYGLLKEIYFNKIDDAKYMYKKSAKKKFALADFNLANLYEKQGKIEKSIKHYIIASENEDSPLIFHNFEFFDILLFISTIFIMCFTNLKLTEYYFSKSNFKESKKYFLKAFAKFNLNDPKTTYQFKLVYHKGKIKDIFTYIKKFILNFPLFHQSDFNLVNNKYKETRTQQVNQANSEQNVDYENSEQNVDYENSEQNNDHENSEQNNDHENSEQNNDHEIKNKKIFKACQKENFDIKLKSKQNDYLEKINQCEFYENEMQINEDKQTFVDLGDLYDFMISDTDIKKVFINEIKIIIDTMEDMIYTPPYHILFGRIENDKHKKTQNSNETVQNINELFYEGLELEELIQ